jgi:transmembrane sensor
VSRKPERQFTVEAGDVVVRVVGTRFRVSEGSDGVGVEVERGVVEVTQGPRTVKLTAGQSWRSQAAEAALAPEPARPTPAAAPVIPARPAVVRRPVKAAPVAAAPSAEPAKGAVLTPAPADLFLEGLEARRSGRPAEAAERFERFVRESRTDARAPIAAFELGRTRMDELRDLKGAAEALKLSLSLSPRGAFREEALSRLVRALDAQGHRDDCVRAQQQYQAAFPSGAYARSVADACK